MLSFEQASNIPMSATLYTPWGRPHILRFNYLVKTPQIKAAFHDGQAVLGAIIILLPPSSPQEVLITYYI